MSSDVTWPSELAGDALLLAARRAGLPVAAAGGVLPRPTAAALASQEAWVSALAGLLALEVSRHDVPYGDLGNVLRRAGLALVPAAGRLLVVVRGRVLAPDGRVTRVAPRALLEAACGPLETAARERLEPVLAAAGLDGRARHAAAAALLGEELADAAVPVCEVRLPPTAPALALARSAGLLSGAVRLVLLDALALAVFLLSWRVLGASLLVGRSSPGWLVAWALLLLTLVPLHRASRRLEASLAVRAGVLLKERLLAGALRLSPETLLTEGAGSLLGRVLEAEALEAAVLAGGLTGLVSAVELAGAMTVLLLAGLPLAAGLLAVWGALAAALFAVALARASASIGHRLAMTNSLVERMVGHRTRLAQLPRERWHETEDQELRLHHQLSLRRDRVERALLTLLPQGFLLAALLALAPAFLGDAVGTPALAAGIGACLLAQNALRRAASAFWHLADARVALRQAGPLLQAAATPEPQGSPVHALTPPSGDLVLSARELRFAYPGTEVPVLTRASVDVRRGERLLLSGPSGGGKSTLAALLAGARRPQAGLLLASGLDFPTLGADGFRRRVAWVPQFHQNHVLTGPLVFNLLMGHPDPASPRAREDAVAVCEELGLGALLSRMPGGLEQMVGETGWQLSHGERSRVYVARALLQGARLVILDESLGALDPETLGTVLDCLARRAESLLVVAHP
jgi:ATP-binding cassette, subfamily B, bacterial